MSPYREVKRAQTRRLSDVSVTFYHNCNEYEKTLIKNQKACFDAFGNLRLAPLLDQIQQLGFDLIGKQINYFSVNR